jgi:hypothetical protein
MRLCTGSLAPTIRRFFLLEIQEHVNVGMAAARQQ